MSSFVGELSCEAVPGEARSKFFAHLYVRYGQFHNADGQMGLIRPDSGILVHDTRGQFKPDWVEVSPALNEVLEIPNYRGR